MTPVGLDPVLALVISICLAALFVTAGIRKLRSPEQFSYLLAGYRILPAALVNVGGRAIPAIELLVAAALLFSPTRSAGGAMAAGLLVIYAVAIAINLQRGRYQLDCGCGGAHERRPIAKWMVTRNLLLAAPALLLFMPLSSHTWGLYDVLTVGGGVSGGTLVFLGCESLLTRNPAREAVGNA